MANCGDCGKSLKKSTSLYCKQHTYQHRTRPSGLVYKIVKENPTWFHRGERANKSYVIPKGTSAWNKGTKGLTQPNATSFTSEMTVGEKNNKWKGDDVRYYALHAWINRKLGKASICDHCGNKKGRVEWANKSHEYKRDTSDWISLCKRCHYYYDQSTWGEATVKFPEINSKKK